ncbi:MAG: phenylalanine--tRNA ligase subunit beta, partial [Oscillospiraceae bacterium]|nr:phenylalanine--tRNA ligase subunit beta [Oscillospiraceae bacterium]
TPMVLFESANFDGVSIRRTATALGMRTDASSRYEKGLDPENTLRAVQRACELVELLGAGEVVEGVIDVYPAGKKETVLDLQPDRINALLGTDIDADTMCVILRKLGFAAENGIITVPSWRGDVEHWSDLAEEVARFYGYNEIPIRFTGAISTCGGLNAAQACEKRIGEVCRSLGLDEIITYSFISPSYYDKIRLPADSPLRESLRILNPLGEDTSIMRTTTLPSMLEILTRNYNYRNREAGLYEIGRTYRPRPDGLADEPKTVSLGAYGEKMNFFVLKGWTEALLGDLMISGARFTACTDDPSFHPGRCARVFVGEEPIGILGQIHPLVMRNYGVEAEFWCAQLSFDALLKLRGATPVFKPLPRFPAVTRDIAVVCDAAIPAGDMLDCIRRAGGETLVDSRVFDVYTGVGIATGKKSVAFSLTMRADDQTLTDEHAEAIVRQVLTALKEQFDAQIR